MEKMNTLPNETIHITSKCIMHLHDHRNKWCLSWNFLYLQILTTTLNFTTSIIAYKFRSSLLEQHQWGSLTCIKYLNTSSLTLVVYIDCKINFNLNWTKVAKKKFAYMPNPKFNNTCIFLSYVYHSCLFSTVLHSKPQVWQYMCQDVCSCSMHGKIHAHNNFTIYYLTPLATTLQIMELAMGHSMVTPKHITHYTNAYPNTNFLYSYQANA